MSETAGLSPAALDTQTPEQRFDELFRFRYGEEVSRTAERVRDMAVETWEILVLCGMYGPGEGRLSTAPFKGGSCLRLMYGSNRKSGDMDFDGPPEEAVPADDAEAEAEASDPRILLEHAQKRLESASETLEALGITDVQYRPVKMGEGTVRLKVSGRAWSGGRPVDFVSKVEISRRRKAGLEEVARVFGTEILFDKIRLDSPLGAKAAELAGRPLDAFVVCYTPLAIFLEKLSAIANATRHSTRDVYDICFLYRRHLAEDPRLAAVMRTYLSAEAKDGRLDGFAENLIEKADRFAESLQDGLDETGTAGELHFAPREGFDPVEAGLDVLEFASEMEMLWKTALEGLER